MDLQQSKRLVFPFILSFSLAACGGGGGFTEGGTTTTAAASGTTTTGTGDTTTNESKAAALEIAASSTQLQSDGTNPVTISAIVKDTGNVILSDVDVRVTVDADASVTETTGTSIRTAQVSPGFNHPENRTLTVTVTTMDGSDLSKTLQVDVVGTEVQIDGPDSISIDTDTVYTIKLRDSSGAGLSNKTVVMESANTTITPVDQATFVTDANGELKVAVRAAQGGTDTVKATALGASASKMISISGESFLLTSGNSEIEVDTPETITLTFMQNNLPIANSDISLSATRGTLSTNSVTTDVNGQATFDITSPTAGDTVITAATTGNGLSTTLTREFVAITPKYMDVKAEPILIAPLGSSTISATVKDINDNPVKNQRVIFNVNDTVNGQLSNSAAITNSLGLATVVYTAGDTTSAFNGVQINSYVDGYAATVNDSLSMTVGGNALRLIMGTNNKVATSGTTNYKMTYGVIVTDGSGNPVPNQAVEFTVVPVSFYKGTLATSAAGWSIDAYQECPIEDANHNGLLEDGEDKNSNGTLEPSNTAAIGGLNATGQATTDSNGVVEIEVIYPQSEAWWSKVELEAKVTVGGTESYERTQFVLPIAADEVDDPAIVPANAHGHTTLSGYGSRYGFDAASATSCNNVN